MWDLVKGVFEVGKTWIGGKQEITKAKTEADVKRILIKAETEADLAKTQIISDNELDKMSVSDMKSSWKDEFITICAFLPFIMCFNPWTSDYAQIGWEAMKLAPEWYVYVLMFVIASGLGLRGLISRFFEVISGSIGSGIGRGIGSGVGSGISKKKSE